MAHTLSELPYAYSALEPYIDAQTMEIHHTKHHQGYVNKLNVALEKYPDWQGTSLHEILKRISEVPEDIRIAVRNNGGGHANHTLFWQCMTPDSGQKPGGGLAEALNQTFGSFDTFKTNFANVAKTRFGSGWAWLVIDSQKKLKIISTPNQDSPLMDGLQPILGLDVWEHAYYLHYQNRRPDYIDQWWNVVNWDFVEQQYGALDG